MSNQITSTDLYECVYYIINGCEITAIEGIKVNSKITCQLTLSGEKINHLQLTYFQGKAEVNLFDFRRAFGQVNALVHSAKKKAKKQIKQQEQSQGGELCQE